MGMDVPAIQPDSPPMSMPMNAPAPTVAPEPSPPPPYSALPPISEEDHPIDFADAFYSPAPYDPCNLFIKNLDDEVVANQADLEIFFSEFGIITSAFLATYGLKDPSHPPVSKGFGFVAFARPDEAELAR
jgi:RNA recognition motif. (a.k.a. RRM, RBD, or RNP domain)